MKKSLSLLFLGLAVMLGLSMAAFASDVTIQFNSVNGSNWNGVDTDPYYGTINGSAATFACDDYPDHITFGESWQATETSLTDLTGVRFPNPHGVSTQQAYLEVAWLAENLLTGTNTNGSGIYGSVSANNELSWAIWSILDNPSPPPAPGTSTAIADAQAWYATCGSGCSVANIYIFTPVAGDPGNTWTDGYPQEFLAEVPPGNPYNTPPVYSFSTPEPVSMLLMGSFLSLAGGFLSRKKRAA